MMKPKKLIGNILMVLGSVVLLISLLGMYLPTVQNRQTQLIVASFQKTSGNGLIQWMNNGMNFAMNHGFLLLLIGIGIVLAGILLIISSHADIPASPPKQRRAATAAAAVSARPVPIANPSVTPRVAPVQPVENNPFARYMMDSALPKSTVSAARPQAIEQSPPAPPASDEAEDSRDDILNIWNKIQEQPEDSEGLYIQPVRVEDDEAYRRPEESAESPIYTQAQVDEEAPLVSPMNEASEPQPAEAAIPQTVAESNMPQAFEKFTEAAAMPVSESLSDKHRPVIRSTFRKSTADQPAQELDIPEEISMPPEPIEPAITPESAMDAPLPPSPSRIKSTMGRKH